MTRAGEVAPDNGTRKRDGALARLRRGLRGVFLHNALLKFVSLILAITLFILVNTSKEAVIGVDVGVYYSMPADRVLVSRRVDHVRVTIKGAWRRIKRFDEREIERIHVDLRDVRGTEYTFPRDAIRLPPSLTLLSIEPASMSLRFENAAQATVPVAVPTAGQPQRGWRVERIVARPSQVTVHGAESVIKNLTSLSTREIDLRGKQASFVETLPLVLPAEPPLIELVDQGTVEVEVVLAEDTATRRMEGVKVAIRPGPGFSGETLPGRFTLEPATVDVILHGPKLQVESLGADIAAYVEAYPDDLTAKAPRQASVHVGPVPAGVGIEILPRTVTLKSRSAE